MPNESDAEKLKVYYDDECLVCSKFIASVKGSSQKENISCSVIQKPDKDNENKEFLAISADGKVHKKFDAVLKIGELYPKWRFFIKIARLPVLYSLLSFGYNIFAAHRYTISRFLDRFNLLKILLILATVSGLLLSPKLWLSSRVYPTVPILPFLPLIPYPFDYLIFALLLGLLVISLWRTNSRKYFATFTILVAIYTLWDWSRLQPWFYQYLLMFMAISFYSWGEQLKKNRRVMLNICCFIVASLYIYSGMQKVNNSFFSSVFPWLVQPLHFLPEALRSVIPDGIFIPFIEMGIGVGLMVRRSRPFAIIAAIGMHLLILFILGPFGHNWNNVVWPWNFAMCGFVLVLFWKNRTFTPSSILSFQIPLGIIIFALCGILPFLSFFGLWDSYLSATLYSGNTKTAQVYIRSDEVFYLDPKLKQYMSSDEEYSVIDFNSWSFSELNVPAYPESRIFKSITKLFCQEVKDRSAILLKVQEKPNWITGRFLTTIYACGDL